LWDGGGLSKTLALASSQINSASRFQCDLQQPGDSELPLTLPLYDQDLRHPTGVINHEWSQGKPKTSCIWIWKL